MISSYCLIHTDTQHEPSEFVPCATVLAVVLEPIPSVESVSVVFLADNGDAVD